MLPVTRPCLAFTPLTPLTNFFKDFRGLPGISPFGHIVFLSSPYKNFEQNKKIYLPYFEIPYDLKHTFFCLKYPEPCPYINSHSSRTVLHPEFIKILGICIRLYPAYKHKCMEMQRLNNVEQRSHQFSAEPS